MGRATEVQYLYILRGDDWPLTGAGCPIGTSVPLSRGDVVTLQFRSDVAEHTVRVHVIAVVHCQVTLSAVSGDAGCQPYCLVLSHKADPIGTNKLFEALPVDAEFLPREPRRLRPRKPKLRIVEP